MEHKERTEDGCQSANKGPETVVCERRGFGKFCSVFFFVSIGQFKRERERERRKGERVWNIVHCTHY